MPLPLTLTRQHPLPGGRPQAWLELENRSWLAAEFLLPSIKCLIVPCLPVARAVCVIRGAQGCLLF